MRISIITLLYLLITLPVYSIYFKNIGIKEGLSQSSVLSIYQDELGRMWFGTREGVNIYDGEKIQILKPTSDTLNLIGNNNYPILGDKQGHVFLQSDNALIQYDIQTDQMSCLKKENVKNITFSNDSLYVCSIDSIFSYKDGKIAFRYKFPVEGGNIFKVYYSSQDIVWIAAKRGLYKLNRDNELVCVIRNEEMEEIYEDSRHNIWTGTRNNGIFKVDPEGNIKSYQQNQEKPNALQSNQIRTFLEDDDGYVWIGTFRGLHRFDPKTELFDVYTHTGLPGGLLHASVFSIYKDLQGGLWVGTYQGGVHYTNKTSNIFTFYTSAFKRDDCLNYPFVGNIVEDKDYNVWICTEGGGLNCLDRKTKRFRHFTVEDGSNSVPHNNLKCICYNKERHTLYIGTHLGGLSIYDLKTKRFKNFFRESSNYWSLAGDAVIESQIYKNHLIILARDGMLKMNLDTHEFSPLFKTLKNSSATAFHIDSAGSIWMVQGDKLIRVNLEDEEDRTELLLDKNLASSGVTKIVEDHNKRIFIGSFGAGLFEYDRSSGQFLRYTTESSALLSDYCYKIGESKNGFLVITSNKGVTLFNPATKEVKIVLLSNGLSVSGISEECGLFISSGGGIFVGGVDGVFSFFEEDLYTSVSDYQLYFSSLLINDEEVQANDGLKILNKSLPFTDLIELEHDQNKLQFSFAITNYIMPLEKVTYQYRLEGLDKKWSSTTEKSITYTNLSPGTYNLVVKEQDTNLRHSDKPKMISMKVIVHPPFYASPFAYVMYVILTLGIMYYIMRFNQSRMILKTSLAFERKDKMRIKELNQTKLRFFTNVSHEFRTPLTIIISQMELLLQNASLAPIVYNKILRVHKQGLNLRNLITELLDFQKLESDVIKLKVQKRNLIPLLSEIYYSFEELAKEKSLSYQFSLDKEEGVSADCWFDQVQLQKVIYNLLSNAIKFSQKQGFVELIVTQEEDWIIIKVIDNGVGISKDALSRIFDRFYRDDTSTDYAVGSGIGLSLTKSIVELHHGTISVESRLEYGSIFTVRLPKGANWFESDPNVSACSPQNMGNEVEDVVSETPSDIVSIHAGQEKEKGTDRSILIVEDNPDLLQLLSSLFAPMYKVSLAVNGAEGLEKALEERPDIILSDVMMPVMSGTEMCMRIKNNFDICHTPVVLLTARTSVEHNIEGLSMGADDYISKPFNTNVLLARCTNLIRNRRLLQKRFSDQIDFTTDTLATNKLDQQFIDQANRIIEVNVGNNDFSVDLLAKEMILSRSSLYAKFKALFGMTPNEYILNTKLKRAAALLTLDPQQQIVEISDTLGFSSSSYFIRCFKEKFHSTPAEYRKQKS